MPFPFVYVCNLLEKLEGLVVRDDPFLPARIQRDAERFTLDWFSNHRNDLNAQNTEDKTVLKIFRPHLFNQGRSYGFDTECMEDTMRRVLGVPNAYMEDLRRWRQDSKCDLGLCVQRVIENMVASKKRRFVPRLSHEVTVEMIDEAFESISYRDPSKTSSWKVHEILRHLFMPLEAKAAKWLTRLFLNDFGLVRLPESPSIIDYTCQLPKCIADMFMPAASRPKGPGLLDLRNVAAPGIRFTITRPTSYPAGQCQLLRIENRYQETKGRELGDSGQAITTGDLLRNEQATVMAPGMLPKPLLAPGQESKKRKFMGPTASPPPLQRKTTRGTQDHSLNTRDLLDSKQPAQKSPEHYSTPASSTAINLAKHSAIAGGSLIPPRRPDSLWRFSHSGRSPTSLPTFKLGSLTSTTATKTTVSSPHSLLTSSAPQGLVSSTQTVSTSAINLQSALAISKATPKPSMLVVTTVSSSLAANTSTTKASSMATASLQKPEASMCKSSSALTPLSSSQQNAILLSTEKRITPRNPASSSLSKSGTGKCKLTKACCPLTNCIFLLSPCVVHNPWITEKLFPMHGVKFISSPRAFTNPSLPTLCSQTKTKYRKIVLVDTFQTERTVEFLRKLANVVQCEEEEMIEVFDWRLLECITKMEQGKVYKEDMWKMYWMCNVYV